MPKFTLPAINDEDDLLDLAQVSRGDLPLERQDLFGALVADLTRSQPLTGLRDSILVEELVNALHGFVGLSSPSDLSVVPSPDVRAVVGGYPRTATTYLHWKLADSMQVSFVDGSRCLRPVGSEAEALAAASRRARVVSSIAPGLEAIHPTSVSEPEECNQFLKNTLASHQFILYGALYEYRRQLHQTDTSSTLNIYSDWLSRHRSGPLVLKSPFYIADYDAVLRCWPTATIVEITGRPIEHWFSSWMNLQAKVYEFLGRPATPSTLETWMAFFSQARVRADEIRAGYEDRFLAIGFDELTSRPAYVVAAIAERCGFTPRIGSGLGLEVERTRSRLHSA